MKECEKIIIYPYSVEVNSLIEYAKLLKEEYEICDIISPSGWGYTKEKFVINNEMIYVKINFDEINKSANILLIPDFISNEEFEDICVNNIIDYITYIKKIICDKKISNNNYFKIKQYCIKHGIELKYKYEYLSEDKKYNIIDSKRNIINEINIPIIAISGLYEYTDKFYTSLVLRDKFIKDGYKVSQIGSRSYCELFGFHSFPQFIFDPKIYEVEKPYLFNKYILDIINNEKPDLLIITIPGAIESISNDILCDFGILSYISFKSFVSDYLIICTLFENYDEKLLEKISESCFYKFGNYIDCFHMSDCLIDESAVINKKIKIHNNIGKDKVTKHINKYLHNNSIPVLNLYDDINKENLYKLILNKISEN